MEPNSADFVHENIDNNAQLWCQIMVTNLFS
jgi:hypothetical protein